MNVFMNALELRTDLHYLIDNVDDEGILKAIKVILSKQFTTSKDWGETLSDNLRSELEASILEADNGELISHEEAIQQIKSRYKI